MRETDGEKAARWILAEMDAARVVEAAAPGDAAMATTTTEIRVCLA